MKQLSIIRMLGIAIAITILHQGCAAEQAGGASQSEARTVAQAYIDALRTKDVDKLMPLLADDFTYAFTGLSKEAFRKQQEEGFKAGNQTLSSNIESVEEAPGHVCVKYTADVKLGPADLVQPKVEKFEKMIFLQRRNGALRVVSAGNQMTSSVLDAATGRIRSATGFSLPLPQGWIPMGAPAELKALVADSVMALAPDLKSFVLLGFVQLPMKLGNEAQTANMALQTDEAMTKQVAKKYSASAPEEMTAGGVKGVRIISEFSIEDQSRKRMRAYFAKDKLLYFFICDAMTAPEFDKLKPTFESTISGFALEPKQGTDVRDHVASQLSQGSVSGNVYQNTDFNCQIAAPKGWELNTSPNPAHLVEMQYKAGKSIARLVAAKGVSADAKKAFEMRIQQVKEIVKDFKETSRRELTVAGVPAMESVHSYTIDVLGPMKVKEVTLVKDGIYYLILCQTIGSDSYEKLEPDYDSIIRSFGFIR